MSDESVALETGDVTIWPPDQAVTEWGDPKLVQTTFADVALYHENLIERLVSLEQERRLNTENPAYACGIKLHNLDSLEIPEVDLLSRRACRLFQTVLNQKQAVVDASWASVYRKGEFCAAHSHLRSTASIVYLLDPGDADESDTDSGRFWIIDPRIAGCCDSQKGSMTTPISPDMVPGTMLIFPGEVIHTVWPYSGQRPRITLSWNINNREIPGAEEFHERRIRRQDSRLTGS